MSNTEAESFTDFINKELIKDQDLKDYLPLQNQDELFSPAKLEDGIILIKLINRCVPDTIDERVVNKGKLNVFQRHENLTLVVKSAQGIGVSTVNVGESDLAEGRAHIRLSFISFPFNQQNPKKNPKKKNSFGVCLANYQDWFDPKDQLEDAS